MALDTTIPAVGNVLSDDLDKIRANWGELVKKAGDTMTGDLVFSSGNISIGGALSGWSGATTPVVEIASNGGPTLYGHTSGGGGMAVNAYWNGANWIYKKTGTLAMLMGGVSDGRISVAPAGTAGASVSFLPAIVIDQNSGAFGYGTGVAGTVTQLTSKSTTVTLNKPTGRITLNASNLAAGAVAGFSFINSAIGSTDLIILNVIGGVADFTTYNVWGWCGSGQAGIYLKNISAGALAEAVVISFAIIKSATS